MGAQNSKPDSSTQHVFSSDTPIQFSQELIDALQASTETNSTRAKALDLHIQQRVAAELERIRAHEDEELQRIRQRIVEDSASESPSSPDSSDSQSLKSQAKSTISSALATANPIQSELTKSHLAQEQDRQAQSTSKVQAEIQRLQKTLAERKTLKGLPEPVQKARDGVVSCLRRNEQRPLDCWREVEIFKEEVRRMEEKFVGDVL